MSANLARRAEAACLNGWPALRQIVLDRALLRLSDGYTRRANSVNLIGPLEGDPGAFVAASEAVYRRHRLPAIFRLSTAVPSDLEAALDAAGFEPAEDASVVLCRDLPGQGFVDRDLGDGDDAEVATDPIASGWLATLAAIQDLTGTQRLIHARILDALAIPAAFALVRCDGRPAAIAFGAVHDGMACLNSVATHPAFRRRGLARRAVAAILRWAALEARATAACLPVNAGNDAALALYRDLGFANEVLRYHYRRKL